MIRRLLWLFKVVVEQGRKLPLVQEIVDKVWPRASAPVPVPVPAPVPVPVPVPTAPVATPVPAPAPAATLRPLGSKETMDGSVWIPRILWALEYAKRHDLGAQTASDISRVLTQHGGLNVPSTNVARAFRERKQGQPSYWKEVGDQRYEISRAGSDALRAQLARPGEA